MSVELRDVPPAVHILLAIFAEASDWPSMRKAIRGSLKDLEEQSVAYEASPERAPTKASPLIFDVHLHGGLDLFDGRGACADIQCRLHAADRLVRSMGLVADHVWLTDLITEKFVGFGRSTNAKIDDIIEDTLVLARLAPLIYSGVIKFRSPWRSVCNGCLKHFDDEIEEIAKEVTSKFLREAKLLRKAADGDLSISTGRFFEPSLVLRSMARDGVSPKLRSVVTATVYGQIRSAFWASRDASLYGGSLFSNSRVGLSGLLQQEGRFEDRKQLMLLDDHRSIQIPWVSELDAGQIVQLRNEASKSLPLFREKFAKTLAIEDDINIGGVKSREFVAELREQAIDVRSELELTKKSSARFWKTTYGLLGLGLSAYGVASDQIIPGVGGLLPIINLLISHSGGSHKDLDKLTRKPGYVLVKAQDILAHSP